MVLLIDGESGDDFSGGDGDGDGNERGGDGLLQTVKHVKEMVQIPAKKVQDV